MVRDCHFLAYKASAYIAINWREFASVCILIACYIQVISEIDKLNVTTQQHYFVSNKERYKTEMGKWLPQYKELVMQASGTKFGSLTLK